MKKTTFHHSGDFGDIIYSLPTIRALGGGSLHIHSTRHVQFTATPDRVRSLASLLEAQSYIDKVEYTKAPVEYDLDIWAPFYKPARRLADACLLAFKLSTSLANEQWLRVSNPNCVSEVVIHRSPRYQSQYFPWRTVLQKYHGRLVMVGLPFEHKNFCDEFWHVPYYPTANYLELAEVIAGSKLFIGNQSSPYAVAEGLKHNTFQEVNMRAPDCVYDRPNAGYGIDRNILLPELP